MAKQPNKVKGNHVTFLTLYVDGNHKRVQYLNVFLVGSNQFPDLQSASVLSDDATSVIPFRISSVSTNGVPSLSLMTSDIGDLFPSSSFGIPIHVLEFV